jgi:hypothetical protein
MTNQATAPSIVSPVSRTYVFLISLLPPINCITERPPLRQCLKLVRHRHTITLSLTFLCPRSAIPRAFHISWDRGLLLFFPFHSELTRVD